MISRKRGCDVFADQNYDDVVFRARPPKNHAPEPFVTTAAVSVSTAPSDFDGFLSNDVDGSGKMMESVNIVQLFHEVMRCDDEAQLQGDAADVEFDEKDFGFTKPAIKLLLAGNECFASFSSGIIRAKTLELVSCGSRKLVVLHWIDQHGVRSVFQLPYPCGKFFRPLLKNVTDNANKLVIKKLRSWMDLFITTAVCNDSKIKQLTVIADKPLTEIDKFNFLKHGKLLKLTCSPEFALHLGCWTIQHVHLFINSSLTNIPSVLDKVNFSAKTLSIECDKDSSLYFHSWFHHFDSENVNPRLSSIEKVNYMLKLPPNEMNGFCNVLVQSNRQFSKATVFNVDVKYDLDQKARDCRSFGFFDIEVDLLNWKTSLSMFTEQELQINLNLRSAVVIQEREQWLEQFVAENDYHLVDDGGKVYKKVVKVNSTTITALVEDLSL